MKANKKKVKIAAKKDISLPTFFSILSVILILVAAVLIAVFIFKFDITQYMRNTPVMPIP
jgi:hypothetical protein